MSASDRGLSSYCSRANICSKGRPRFERFLQRSETAALAVTRHPLAGSRSYHELNLPSWKLVLISWRALLNVGFRNIAQII
jgi:hypothetical protein